jgi:hypothetical protein
MTTTEMDPVFASALREALIANVDRAPRRRRRWQWRLGIGVCAGSIVVGGGVALAAGVFSPSGAPLDTQLGDIVTVTRTGSATVDLGPVPASATNISLSLTCLSVGTFDFPDGSSMTCSPADISGAPGTSVQSTEVVPRRPGQHTVTIDTSADASWTLQAVYLNRVTTSWGTNASGQTYGVPNQNGVPDLVAVTIDQGTIQGYVKDSDLNCASGKYVVHSPAEALAWDAASKNRNISIPVYESDGRTAVGVFVVGGGGAGATTVPLQALARLPNQWKRFIAAEMDNG